MTGEPSESDVVIHAANLQKSYGDFMALRGIDFDVRRGEVFGFLGPNGAGKTTAIRCLLDLIRPCGGELKVLGMEPRKHAVEVRRSCGYLPGELRLDENMHVRTTLQFFREMRNGDADCVRRGEEISERLGLDPGARVKNLSKGNKQKIGIVAAFMHKPELLLLDEPTSGLDPLVQQSVLELVREAREDGSTVFFSSHVLAEVQEIAGRVAIIREGKIVETGHTAGLTGEDLSRVKVGFSNGSKVSRADFEAIEGISVVGEEQEGRLFRLSVEGAMDELIKMLARHEVDHFESRRPSLEEVFLAHYGNGDRPMKKEAGA